MKIRGSMKGIKVLDKSINISKKTRDIFIRTKEKTEETQSAKHTTPAEYAESNITDTVQKTAHDIIYNFRKPQQKASEQWTRAKGTIKTAKKSIKTAKKSVKTAKSAVKTTQKTVETTKRTVHTTAKIAIRTTKATVKVVIALTKAAIAATKGLIAILAAGGWIAVMVILMICMAGLFLSSTFSIFFSDKVGESGKTVNSVITEIDNEYTETIEDIIDENAYDLLDMSGAKASWKEVLAVYAVKVSTDPDNPMEVATIDDEKAELLRIIFWEMNTISTTLDSESVVEDAIGDDGLPTGEINIITVIILRISVTYKTPDEMVEEYGFTDGQASQLAELLKPEYHNLWNALLYGITTVGNDSMIEVAATQIGNIGGEPYWNWYGFASRVEWCACFVSWVADQCGYIDAGVIPKFASCTTGVQWFRDRGQWQDNTYTPKPGDIIFFDWESDGVCDHVGIVESVDGGMVNTIEGNSSDSVARRSYGLGSDAIFGFGIPGYP